MLTEEFINEFMDNFDKKSIVHPRFIFKNKTFDTSSKQSKICLQILDIIHRRFKNVRNKQGEKLWSEINNFTTGFLTNPDLYCLDFVSIVDYFTFIVIISGRKDLLKYLPYDPVKAINVAISYNNYEITNFIIKNDCQRPFPTTFKDQLTVYNIKDYTVLKPIIKKYGYIDAVYSSGFVDINLKYMTEEEARNYIRDHIDELFKYKGKWSRRILNHVFEIAKDYSNEEWINIVYKYHKIDPPYFCDYYNDKILSLIEQNYVIIKDRILNFQSLRSRDFFAINLEYVPYYILKRYPAIKIADYTLELYINYMCKNVYNYLQYKWFIVSKPELVESHRKEIERLESKVSHLTKAFDLPELKEINYGSNGNFNGPVNIIFDYLVQ